MFLIKNKFGTELVSYENIFCNQFRMFPSNVDKSTF